MEDEPGLPSRDLWANPSATPEAPQASQASQGAVPAAGLPDYLSPRHRRVWLPVFVSVVVVIGLAVAGIVISSGSAVPGAGMAPADFVLSATQTTLTQKTVDLVFSGTISVRGHSAPITGSGEANLSEPQQFSASVGMSLAGVSLHEQEVLADGHFYMGIESDGQDVSSLVPGKHWVELPIPVGATSSVGTGTSDPLAELQMLATKGNTVTTLGTRTIEGVTASGYSVAISRQNLLNDVQRELSSSGLDPAQQQQLAQAAQSFPPPTIDVWFDSSKLLRRMGFAVNETQDGASVSVDVQMDFVNYGAPVSVSVPAPGDVASYSQFQAAANAASGSAG